MSTRWPRIAWTPSTIASAGAPTARTRMRRPGSASAPCARHAGTTSQRLSPRLDLLARPPVATDPLESRRAPRSRAGLERSLERLDVRLHRRIRLRFWYWPNDDSIRRRNAPAERRPRGARRTRSRA